MGYLCYVCYVNEYMTHMSIIEPCEELVERIRNYVPAGVYQG